MKTFGYERCACGVTGRVRFKDGTISAPAVCRAQLLDIMSDHERDLHDSMKKLDPDEISMVVAQIHGQDGLPANFRIDRDDAIERVRKAHGKDAAPCIGAIEAHLGKVASLV